MSTSLIRGHVKEATSEQDGSSESNPLTTGNSSERFAVGERNRPTIEPSDPFASGITRGTMLYLLDGETSSRPCNVRTRSSGSNRLGGTIPKNSR